MFKYRKFVNFFSLEKNNQKMSDFCEIAKIHAVDGSTNSGLTHFEWDKNN